MMQPAAGAFDIDALDFAKGGGVVTMIAQDVVTGAVLMVAQANREAVEHTLATGEMHYTSRSRGLWHKGATSGNVQRVVSLAVDCDADAVLALVKPAGPACHTGTESCFGEAALRAGTLAGLDRTIASRAAELRAHAEGAQSAGGTDSGGSTSGYTHRLLQDRNLRLKKLGEEAVELAVACADNDATRVADECADLVYHVLVSARAAGVTLADVLRVLDARSR